jgi:hypothetical protein
MPVPQKIPPGSRATFWRAMATLAILVLGVVAYVSVSQRVDRVEQNTVCEQDINSLACKVRSCVRAEAIGLKVPDCLAIEAKARRHGIHKSAVSPTAAPQGGGRQSNPSPGSSQPTPPPVIGGGGDGSTSGPAPKAPAVNVQTPPLLVPAPQVCVGKLLGVNC